MPVRRLLVRLTKQNSSSDLAAVVAKIVLSATERGRVAPTDLHRQRSPHFGDSYSGATTDTRCSPGGNLATAP